MKNYFPEEIKQFHDISNQYEIYFVDLWGVIHNGIKLFDNAVQVLRELKKINKKVILISNAPRLKKTVKKFLEKLNFDLDLVEMLITSGDVTQNYILKNKDKFFYHLGPKKDADLFENVINISKNSENCLEIVCTGLIDEIGHNISDYQNLFETYINENKTFVCANPDEVVSRGNKIEFCAGALAKYYKNLGGKVTYFGKPHHHIYDFAKIELERRVDRKIQKKEILAVGDNLKTDILGAQNFNIDSLLILNGIYKDFFRNNDLNFDKLIKSSEAESLIIKKYQQELKWKNDSI